MGQQNPWYLVQTKPQSHRIAERNLARQKFPTFLPQIRTTSAVNGQFVTKTKPLFPGYIFVTFDLHSAAPRQINGTLGVSRLVNVAGRPAEVPPEIIKGLCARCDEDYVLDENPVVERGGEIRVLTGPFANFVATVDQVDASKRIWVLLNVLGRETRVALGGASWRAA